MPINPPPQRLQHLPDILLAALHDQCEGDWRRVTVDMDGTVTVHNQPQIVRVELKPEGTTARKIAEHGRRRSAPRPQQARDVGPSTVRPSSAPPDPTPAPMPVPPSAEIGTPIRAPSVPTSPGPAGAPPMPRFEPPGATGPAPSPPARQTPAGDTIPRHPRTLKKRLRELGAEIGEVGPDGRALVTFKQRKLGRVMLTDYRTSSAAAEWKALLATIEQARS